MTSLKQKRYRSFILTPSGLQKLLDRIQALETKTGIQYTPRRISEQAQLKFDQGLHPDTVRKILRNQFGVDEKSISLLFRVLGLSLEPGDYTRPEEQAMSDDKPSSVSASTQIDWGEAPDVSIFFGRTAELVTLEQWVVEERCRVVVLLGMGGMGKTSLSVKLVEQIQDKFVFVIWRSLRYAPSVPELLADCIKFFSQHQEAETDLGESINSRISRLIYYLQNYRCLLVLDNAESILISGGRAGDYREGYEGYGELLKRLGETSHQSCLILTSREKPKEIIALEGKTLPVRSLKLPGLNQEEARQILQSKGLSVGDEPLEILLQRYAGNALALKIISTNIQDLFNGDIAEFIQQDLVVFGDIQDLISQQLNRLSPLERELVYWLTINRELISLAELKSDLIIPVAESKLLETLGFLERRSILEKSAARFTLQPLMMEYLTNQLIELVCEEVLAGEPNVIRKHALLKTQKKDYVKAVQRNQVLVPVIDRLLAIFRSKKNVDRQLSQILSTLPEQSPIKQGYTGGNIINLLCQLQVDLSKRDFSRLTIWQADLSQVNLHDCNFAASDLTDSVFAQTLRMIVSLAFSPNGKLLATGDIDGKIRIMQVATAQQLLTWTGHSGWVKSLAFSPDGQYLASGGFDATIKIWEVSTGQCLEMQGHTSRVRSLAFHPQSDTLVSGGDDQTIRVWQVSTGQLTTWDGHAYLVSAIAYSPDGRTLASGSSEVVRIWEVSTGRCLKALQGHQQQVRTVAFSPDGRTLASGSDDHTIRLWDATTGQCLTVLEGHTNRVRCVAFSGDGLLVSGSADASVRLWDLGTGQSLKVLQAHNYPISAIALSPDGETLASSSEEKALRLWNIRTGYCLKTIVGYSNEVRSLAFIPTTLSTKQLLASGSDDHTLKLWDIATGECIKTLQGHRNYIWSIAVSPNGRILASSSEDQTVKLWDITTGKCIKTFSCYTYPVSSVTFSPDGQLLATGSDAPAVRCWNIHTGQCIKVMHDTPSWVWCVTFSPDSKMLAGGCEDEVIRLWNVSTGECIRKFCGHTNWVWSVIFSTDGKMLASGSIDHTIRLWDLSTGECIKILQGHSNGVMSVALNLDGSLLASGSEDKTVRLWDVSTGCCLKIFSGHTNRVRSVKFSLVSEDSWKGFGEILASGSEDETIRLWDINTGECLRIFSSKRPYEGMNITNVTGLTDAQIAILKALGAVGN